MAAYKFDTEPVSSSGRARQSGVFENRKSERRELDARVTLSASAGPAIDGWSLNISDGGIRVLAEAPLFVGEEVDLEIHDVPEHPGPRKARVVWVRRERDGSIAGLQFVECSGLHRIARDATTLPAPPSFGEIEDLLVFPEPANDAQVDDAHMNVGDLASLLAPVPTAGVSEEDPVFLLLKRSLPSQFPQE
jgi:hypothetical protein